MRKAKLYQLLAVAGGLGVAVASTPALAKDLTSNPLNWAAGSATVDGDIADWGDLSSAPFNRMCEAGRLTTTGECDGKDQLSTLYSRYDCDTDTMYFLVLKEDGHTADDQRWVKIYDLANSEHSVEMADVVVDGVSQGYEASFTVAGGTTYTQVEVHINIDGGKTSSTGKKNTDISIAVPVSCEMPVVEEPPAEEPPAEEPPAEEPPAEEPPVEEPPAEEPPVEEPPAEEPPVEEPPAEEPPAEEPPAEEPPVEEPTSGGGNPNMACSEIMGSNGAPMSLIAKYETDDDGNYNFAQEGTDIINIEGNIEDALSGGTFSVDGDIVKVAAVIVKGGTVALPDEDGNDSFSNAGLVNNGNQIADISNVQFCQEGVFDSAGAEVCLWSANKDADGNYINIEQVGCVDAEKGKFYAIEAAGEFSNALEAE